MSGFDIIPLPGHPGMFARRVAVEAWQRAGSPRVSSAGRLYAVQKYFWDGWRKRLPGFNPADNPDDESQRLAHVRFVAFDIDPTADRIRRLTAAGFVRPYSYEPWHWELPNVRSYGIVRSIPSTAGDSGTTIGDTLSAAEVAEIKAHIDKQTSNIILGIMTHLDGDVKLVNAELARQTSNIILGLMEHMDGDREKVLAAIGTGVTLEQSVVPPFPDAELARIADAVRARIIRD